MQPRLNWFGSKGSRSRPLARALGIPSSREHPGQLELQFYLNQRMAQKRFGRGRDLGAEVQRQVFVQIHISSPPHNFADEVEPPAIPYEFAAGLHRPQAVNLGLFAGVDAELGKEIQNRASE